MTASSNAPPIRTLAWSMFRLGLVSFGGNNALLVTEHVVDRKGWLSLEQMEEAIALSTLAPGGNSSNLSYEVGRRIGGTVAGLVSYVAMALPGVVLILAVGSWLLQWDQSWIVGGAMAGAQAAAVALVSAIGLQLGRDALRVGVDWILALALFAAVGLLELPLEICVPVGVAAVWLLRRKRG